MEIKLSKFQIVNDDLIATVIAIQAMIIIFMAIVIKELYSSNEDMACRLGLIERKKLKERTEDLIIKSVYYVRYIRDRLLDRVDRIIQFVFWRYNANKN